METVRSRAVKLLLESHRNDKYVDRVLTKSLSDKQIPEQDKRFLTEIIKGSTRMKGLLDFYVKELMKGRLKDVKLSVRYILRLGLYQLIYMDSVPTYAAINESVNLAKEMGNERAAGLVNAILRNFERRKPELQNKIESFPDAKRISIKYSHPEWLITRWIKRFGIQETKNLCAYNNKASRISFRLNQLQEAHPRFQKLLESTENKLEKSEFLDSYYILENRLDKSVWEAVDDGELTVQDVSAGLPVKLLSPKPGETVIDMCAAPGGKTGAIAEAMGDRGNVIAVDSDKYRLSLVREHGERLGLTSIEYVHGDGTEIKLPKADRILVDAPCSGTGVLAKRADIRWRRKETDIKNLVKLQQKLLQHASIHLKTGGILVYSTCTMEEEENWMVVEEFLENNSEFKIDDAGKFITNDLIDEKGAVATYPYKHYIDGSFCVRMTKN